MTDFTHVRDSIIIDSALKALLDQRNLPPGSTVFLIARRIVHFPTSPTSRRRGPGSRTAAGGLSFGSW